MPRFYIHLQNGETRCDIDEQGVELPDMAAARALALKSAGQIIAEEIGAGRTHVPLSLFIDRKNGEPLVTIRALASIEG